MNRCLKPLRRGAALCGVGIVLNLLLVPWLAWCGEPVVPSPQQACSDEAALVVYFNVKGASDSTIGKTLAPFLKALPEQMGKIPSAMNVPVPSPEQLALLESLQGIDLAEVALVMEGKTVLGDPAQMSEDDSLLVVAKLTQVLDDQETLISQLLSLAEQHQSGLSNKVAQTRSLEGAAEMFAIPPEAMGGARLPFPVSLAVGPGDGGSVVAFGQTDRLKRFVSGSAPAQLPAKVDRLLAARGQLWLYFVVPPEAVQELGQGGSQQANQVPMMDQWAEALKGLEAAGINVNLGSTSLEFEVALQFNTPASASDMANGVQGYIALVNVMKDQNPFLAQLANWSGFQRLKASAAGPVFRLQTYQTAAEVRRFVDMADRDLNFSDAATASPKMPEVKPPEEKEPELELQFLEMLPETQGHVRYGKLRVKNPASKAVANFRVTFVYLDERGSKLGEWTRLQQELTPVVVGAGLTRELQVPLFNLPLRTAQVRAVLRRVQYTDGTLWP